MKLEIIHETNYAFESGVFLEPHILRFRPKNTAYQTLEYFELIVSPKPAGLFAQTDE
jgi:hypothetical protein